MTHVLGRSTRLELPVAVRGEGIHLYDSTGKRYLDASGGAAVSCLGHGHSEVNQAIKDQVDKLAYVHTSFFTSEAQEALADNLVARAPAGLGHVYFVSGGSEAVEAALKLARQYHLERGEPQRAHIVSRWFSFHGNTLGALAAGGNIARRKVYAPLLFDVRHISPCFAYRGQRDGESEAAYGLRVADELEAAILELGPETVCAFIAETVVGATIGAVAAVPGYFKRVREICDRYGVLLILDEVMCGMGRTGTLYASEQEGIVPDILVMAKGLGAGYQPIGAMLVADRIFDAIAGGSGAFMHGHTYMGHPIACAAALAVQRVIERDGLLANVRRQGKALEAALVERFGNHRHVGDIRGRGLFWALELVRERSTKAPFPAELGLHARVKRLAMARGLMCYPMGGTVDGKAGDHVLLAPPFIATEAEIAEIVGLLGEAVEAAIGEVG
ncbi:MAG TPA: aspartate aminotransferase family protein [Alphaproteobacteria bacterium]|nr:aspartate aminotransferase family protein [Alphaproteobacteria bacterium]